MKRCEKRLLIGVCVPAEGGYNDHVSFSEHSACQIQPESLPRAEPLAVFGKALIKPTRGIDQIA